jgi:hypothetical protein
MGSTPCRRATSNEFLGEVWVWAVATTSIYCKFVKGHLRLAQVGRFEALREPVVNAAEKPARLVALALASPQAAQAQRGTQLP